MGVPKFARFICERYPCIIELLNEYQIPEFDNLYLDMNGIIHCCSHPNDADAHFRITEEAIFKNIFHYIEILFRTINPQKLFFMAVDGVAPRAKINQQRGRRFRTAKDAELVEARARARGESIPTEARFDSNCITPGTVFMAKLTEQLKYFVTYKISTDKLWQKCKIILSGPEVPGEGEHKIMDYIRYMKSQPDHDPNTRHCLYGLDADLIMLGLCTHEPHFAVLREEVKFGRNVQKTISPEKTKFCLLHLSLLREYLDHEFESLKSTLSFAYDLEKIIDDWILMGFLIGNDFIPHLPHIHIINGSFPVLYHAYMEVLPTLDGYINEAGYLNLPRFEKFMERLAAVDIDRFADHQADLKYFEAKTGRLPNEHERTVYRKNKDSGAVEKLNNSNKKQLNALIQQTDEILQGHSDEEPVDSDSESDLNGIEFLQHKRDYYLTKFDYTEVDESVMRSQAEGYVTAIQWILHYYYNGCQSWSWFYPHHYAPYISDIKDFKDFKFNFEMGKPFLPFEQLLAVLPAASKSLLPEVYQGLLTEEASPIIDYYPLDFQTDMNEKKQEWEAVVLIPFIDEDKLIAAMEPLNHKLTPDERKRNCHGPMYVIKYIEHSLGIVRAPDYFPAIESHAEIVMMNPEAIIVPADKLVKGLCMGAKLNVFFHGFPTLQHIEHTAKFSKAKVKVFEQTSQNENMILSIVAKESPALNTLAAELLGKLVFVKWPHLLEALVVAVSNGERKFSLIDTKAGYSLDNLRREELKNASEEQWRIQAQSIAGAYKSRYGIDVGETKLLIHARTISGRRYVPSSQGRLSLQQEWSTHAAMFAYQTILRDTEVERDGYVAHKNISDVFRPKSVCFMLGHPHYGAIGEVIEPGVNAKTGRVKVAMRFAPEPSFENLQREQEDSRMHYMYGNIAANRLGISAHLLSRITGTIYVQTSRNEQERKPNIGLNLKYNKRNEELPGYTKKFDNHWTYSMKSVELIRAYMTKFPILFEYLAANVSNDVLQENLFPHNVEDLSSVISWLNEQPFRNVSARSCNFRGIEPDIIDKIMAEGSKYAEEEQTITKTVLMQVKSHLLYKPDLSAGNIAPDPTVRHRIFDRIITSKEGFCVPLGYKGTIIAVHNDDPNNISYDILFDKPFIGHLSETGSGTMRRYKLFTAEFINISYGIRAEEDITGLGVMLTKLIEKKSSNENSPKPQKPSAFASYNKHGNFFPEFGKERNNKSQASEPKIRVMKKDPEAKINPNSPLKKSIDAKNESARQQSKKSMQESKELPQAAAINQVPANSTPNTEFQMLWNELHKSQAASTTPKPMVYPMPQQIPPVHLPPNVPQDPSAVLKAVLKISDDSSTSSTYHPPSAESFGYVPRPVPPPPLNIAGWMDQLKQFKPPVAAPPVKDPCYYSTLLLNHMQRIGAGVPRYYFSPHNNLIRSSIVLSDLRVFQGDLCTNHHLARENVSAKVCQELKIEAESCKPQNIFKMMPPDAWINSVHHQMQQPPMNMQSMMSPRSFLDSQMPNMRPPVPGNPHMPQSAAGFPQKTPVRPPHMNPPRPLGAERKDLKQSTPFVPLQAQKKTRGRKVESVQASKNPEVVKTPQSPKLQKASKSADSKHVDNVRKGAKSVYCNDLIIVTCEGSKDKAPAQKAQKPPKQRKSRIAANFGSASVATANGADAQKE